MRVSPFWVLTTVISGCSPRSHATPSLPPALAGSAIDEAFDRHARVAAMEPPAPVSFLEPVSIATLGDEPQARAPRPIHVTLGALAAAEGWGITPCSGDRCPEVVEASHATVHDVRRASPHRAHGDPIEALRLVGVDSGTRCTWRVLARVAGGWLGSLPLGVSAAGCKVPFDRAVVEGEDGLWFPLSLTVAPGGLRLEGQGADPWELGFTDDDPSRERALERVVHLCRVGALGPDTLACARREGPGRASRATLTSFLAAPPLVPDASVAPLSELTRAGSEWPARWLVAPPRGGDVLGPLTEYGELALVERSLGTDRTLVVASGIGHARLLVLERGGATIVAEHHADYENEQLVVEAIAGDGTVAQVSLALTSDGPTRLTWRWDEVLTPSSHFRLATGIVLESDGETLGAWRRTVEADPTGVTLRAHGGALAWFRGTGRYDWGALEVALARWRRAYARAWAEAREAREVRDDGEASYGKRRVARLSLLPGFIEPLDPVLVDEGR